MIASGGYVWYACYGSNLNRERFMYYIKGGDYPVTGRKHDGCTDKTPPQGDRPWIIPHDRYFGNESQRWECRGVAFIDPDVAGETLGRLYLITRDQFIQVKRDEGDCDEWYGNELVLGESEGVPIVTLTSLVRHQCNWPSRKYLEVMLEGITQMRKACVAAGIDPEPYRSQISDLMEQKTK